MTLALGNVIYDQTRRMIICLPSKPAKGELSHSSHVSPPAFSAASFVRSRFATSGYLAPVIVIKLGRVASFPLRARAYNRIAIAVETAVASHARLIPKRGHRSCVDHWEHIPCDEVRSVGKTERFYGLFSCFNDRILVIPVILVYCRLSCICDVSCYMLLARETISVTYYPSFVHYKIFV